MVQVEDCDQSIFNLGWKDTTPALIPTWFRISRIGISSGSTCKMYLDAIQRILHSLNDETEILFLVKNSKKKIDLFLGIRFRKKASKRAATKAISSYANGIWKGLELSAVNEEERRSIDEFENSNSQQVFNKAYDTIYALTGIPSANEDDVVQMTIERFLSGAAKENVALLISATPLKVSEIDDSLYALREIGERFGEEHEPEDILHPHGSLQGEARQLLLFSHLSTIGIWRPPMVEAAIAGIVRTSYHPSPLNFDA